MSQIPKDLVIARICHQETAITPYTLDREIEQQRDYFLVAGFGFGLFERTWALRGFNEALMDAAADPGFYDDLVEAIAEHQLEVIEQLLQLPVDGIMFSDDWGYQTL